MNYDPFERYRIREVWFEDEIVGFAVYRTSEDQAFDVVDTLDAAVASLEQDEEN